VVIDDRLPSSRTSRLLHVVDRNNPSLLWPALVEKAYLKVRGGYDFPGSNSGTDLWVLSGWIPEQVFLHHEDVTSDQLWRRLFKAFQYGDVLLTVGTGKLTEREEQLLGLISQHDYAVLDMTESEERRRMLIKNPWAEMNAHATQDIIGIAAESGQETSLLHNQLTPGSFWMDCDKVFQNFENLYLNWNPGLFRFREDIHFSWDLSKPRGNPGCFVGNPQFSVSSVVGGPVWLLLSKHFTTTNESKSQPSSGASNEPGFISIYVYKKDGQRVYLSDGAFHRSPFVDSPNTLARLEMPAHTSYTIVVAEQSLPSLNKNFTLSAFSRDSVTIAHADDKFAHVVQMHGDWNVATAGGNAESPGYPSNPQFSLQLSEAADVSILLETPEPDLAVHVKLFWSDGKRISTVRKRDIIADSGDYRRGCAVAETDHLGKGSYTIVCSTFAPDQVAKFTLWISSTRPCDVTALASEAAGRHAVISDVGVFLPGTDRILAPLTVPRLTRLKLIARVRDSLIGNRSVAASPMLMTVELGQGPYKEVLASSEGGEYSDSVSGIRVEDFDIRPEDGQRGGIWIVIERIGGPGGQVEDYVEVEALGEERVEIGEWTA
jgi:calpain-7